ncbi:hypothetical protein E3N88_06630 [Mikania micrantha]|uniref:Uncharacterized protein n=1 Tax=Mikania micrantha TaxID=192012 RepID=A0A5N6PP73_9ASTR|nr:hypothetical protein E3N88_06630 [Mikania micrantha]
MESNGVASYRHRRSPSFDRFLGVFSPPSSSGVISGGSSVAGDDFSEDDVFWTGDFAEPKRQSLKSVKGNNWSPNDIERINGVSGLELIETECIRY